MSLGTWFKDYVYIPLGGNRVNSFKIYRNLFVVWVLTGLWHGASWNFVIWGLYFGAIIAIEKAGLLRFLDKLWRPIRHTYVIFILLIGWVFFVYEDISLGLSYLKGMFGLKSIALYDTQFLFYIYNYAITLMIAILGSTPFIKYKYTLLLKELREKQRTTYESIIVSIIFLGILFLSTAYLVDATYNPFLYFRF